MKEETADKILHVTDKIFHVSKRFCQTLGLGIIINAVSIPITHLINENIIPKGETAVFTSGDDNFPLYNYTITTTGIDFFMYAPVTLKQNLEGNHVVWHSGLTNNETLDILVEEKINNVIFIGHGTNDYFVASNGDIYSGNIPRHGITKKDGMLIQYTCGSEKADLSMSEALLKNPENSFSFDDKINSPTIYLTTIKHLFTGY